MTMLKVPNFWLLLLCEQFWVCVLRLYFCFYCLVFTISFLFTGTKSLAEILSDRESIAKDMLTSLDESTDPWGIKVGIFLNRIRNVSQK